MIPNQPIVNRQTTNLEIIHFRVDVSEVGVSNATALPEGSNHAVVTKNGTGDYTFTLTMPGLRSCAVVGVAPVGAQLVYNASTISASAVRVIFANTAGTATDADFHLTVAVFRTIAVY